jgi:hypothetical protein
MTVRIKTKAIIYISIALFAIFGYAVLMRNYEYNRREVILVNRNTGIPVADKEIVVYFWYEYPCLSCKFLPQTCVDGPALLLHVSNGHMVVSEKSVKKNRILGYHPQIRFQIGGTCKDQEWHPGECTKAVPLKDYNDSNTPLTVPFPLIPQIN